MKKHKACNINSMKAVVPTFISVKSGFRAKRINGKRERFYIMVKKDQPLLIILSHINTRSFSHCHKEEKNTDWKGKNKTTSIFSYGMINYK